MKIKKKIPYREGKVNGLRFQSPPVGFEEALIEFSGSEYPENHTCYHVVCMGQKFWMEVSDDNYFIGTLV